MPPPGPTLTQQREAAGLPLYTPEAAPRTYHRVPGAHDGGKQSKKQVRTWMTTTL
jgi:hypothetical protein